MLIKYLVIELYIAMVAVIGILGLQKTRSFNDYFLGGGKVGAWIR